MLLVPGTGSNSRAMLMLQARREKKSVGKGQINACFVQLPEHPWVKKAGWSSPLAVTTE